MPSRVSAHRFSRRRPAFFRTPHRRGGSPPWSRGATSHRPRWHGRRGHGGGIVTKSDRLGSGRHRPERASDRRRPPGPTSKSVVRRIRWWSSGNTNTCVLPASRRSADSPGLDERERSRSKHVLHGSGSSCLALSPAARTAGAGVASGHELGLLSSTTLALLSCHRGSRPRAGPGMGVGDAHPARCRATWVVAAHRRLAALAHPAVDPTPRDEGIRARGGAGPPRVLPDRGASSARSGARRGRRLGGRVRLRRREANSTSAVATGARGAWRSGTRPRWRAADRTAGRRQGRRHEAPRRPRRASLLTIRRASASTRPQWRSRQGKDLDQPAAARPSESACPREQSSSDPNTAQVLEDLRPGRRLVGVAGAGAAGSRDARFVTTTDRHRASPAGALGGG